MDIIAQLERLDELIIADRPAHIAEMRNIVAFIREQLPAYQALAIEHAALKDAHLKLQTAQPTPTPNYGSQPRVKGRTEK